MAYVRGELHPTELAGTAPVAPLIFEGATDLRGTTRLTFAWPAGRLSVAGGALAWQPLRGNLSIERDAQRLAWQLETPALHFTGEAGAGWRIEALQLRAALREGIAGFPLGKHRWQPAPRSRRTTPGTEEVRQRREQLPTMSSRTEKYRCQRTSAVKV